MKTFAYLFMGKSPVLFKQPDDFYVDRVHLYKSYEYSFTGIFLIWYIDFSKKKEPNNDSGHLPTRPAENG
ncbi:hypothetical protein ABH899_003432 [Paenibacillus sp. RC84]